MNGYNAVVEKVVRILKPGEDEEALDWAFWQSKTPNERIEAAEILRRRITLITHADQSRLQRVFRIVQHA